MTSPSPSFRRGGLGVPLRELLGHGEAGESETRHGRLLGLLWGTADVPRTNGHLAAGLRLMAAVFPDCMHGSVFRHHGSGPAVSLSGPPDEVVPDELAFALGQAVVAVAVDQPVVRLVVSRRPTLVGGSGDEEDERVFVTTRPGTTFDERAEYLFESLCDLVWPARRVALEVARPAATPRRAWPAG